MSGRYAKWVTQLEVGTLIDLDDVQRAFPDKTRDALKMALGRICEADDPLLARMTRGIYCRRMLGERSLTGVPLNDSTPLEAWAALPWRLAGLGAGLTGINIVNKVGWSTQVPVRYWIAVVGRPPQHPEVEVLFVGRSNQLRRNLTIWEVSLLEAVRCFDDWSEMSWDDALDRFRWKSQRGSYGNNKIRQDLFLQTAKAEKGLGSEFQTRCAALATAATAGLST